MSQHLENLQPTSKAARLRALLPLIEQKIAAGVRYQAIVQALKADGLELTEATFRYYLHNERRKSAGKQVTAPQQPQHTPATPVQPSKPWNDGIQRHNPPDADYMPVLRILKNPPDKKPSE